MPAYVQKVRSGNPPVQAAGLRLEMLCYALTACLGVAGCDPLDKPIDLYHGLEGGEIAAERPPPPGAGLPYPHVGTVPPRPEVAGAGFRTALATQLAAERDQKELLAADLPQEKVPPPPGAAAPPPAAAPPDDTAGTNATISAADAPAPAKPPGPPAPPPVPQDAGLQIVGEPIEYANLPLVPDGPPAPPAFGGVPAEPAPVVRQLPNPDPLPAGKQVFFANGAYALTPSQDETLNDILGSRGKRVIDIIGLGEADSDTPLGQEAAIDLALRRARAIADFFASKHVPQSDLHISARPFGRGAVVRVI